MPHAKKRQQIFKRSFGFDSEGPLRSISFLKKFYSNFFLHFFINKCKVATFILKHDKKKLKLFYGSITEIFTLKKFLNKNLQTFCKKSLNRKLYEKLNN